MLKTVTNLVDASQIKTPIALPGDVTLSTGNLVIGTSGKGIDFSATSDAGGMASELLDDYEEGTWTPSLGGDATYTGRVGTYTKIGRQVFVQGVIIVDVLGTGSVDTISGLPFSASAGYAGNTSYFASLASSFVYLGNYAQGTTIRLVGLTAASANISGTPTVFGNGARVDFSLTYFV